MASIRDILGDAEVLTAIAEESAELAQAALKLRRAMTGISPTPITAQEATEMMFEEIADVCCCLDELPWIDWSKIDEITETKRRRWMGRLIGGMM